MAIGVKALGTSPRKSIKRNSGEKHAELDMFGQRERSTEVKELSNVNRPNAELLGVVLRKLATISSLLGGSRFEVRNSPSTKVATPRQKPSQSARAVEILVTFEIYNPKQYGQTRAQGFKHGHKHTLLKVL
ncbi:hypothetical protein BASA81_003885 [Batrachochytrium salamandrivorans]|nr:hypothetical protein BASA81_003885 [Batrachochytrium salamandrivorans]